MSNDMMIYASTDASCLFGLLVLISKRLIMMEKQEAQHMTGFEVSKLGNTNSGNSDLLISAIENGRRHGHTNASSGCCPSPSFLGAIYDRVTSNDAMYDMDKEDEDDDDDDAEIYDRNAITTIRGLLRTMARRCREMWHDWCDDIFLTFGDFMVGES